MIIRVYLIPPEGGSEQRNKRDDFETSRQHQARHYPFARSRKEVERTRDARDACTQTIVGDARERGEERIDDGEAFGNEHHTAHHDQQRVDEDECSYLAATFLIDMLAVDIDGSQQSGTDIFAHHEEEVLCKIQQSIELGTTCSRTRASTHIHHKEREREHEDAPSFPVACTISGGRHRRNDVEQRVDRNALPPRVVMPVNNCSHHHHIEHPDGIDEGTEHIVAPEFAPRLPYGYDYQAETYTADEHEQGKNRLDVGRFVGGNTVVMRRIAACRDAGQRVADAIEEVDGSTPKQQYQHQGEQRVKSPKHLGGAIDACCKLVVGDACGFGMEQHKAAAVVQGGDKRERKKDDAQTANPLCQRPPHKNSLAATFDIANHGSTCCRESRHRFEERFADIQRR